MNSAVRFGAFELDPEKRELRKRGIRLRVRDQSIDILAMLVQRPGEIVTREEIQTRLWPDGTVVEFEHSVNTAINRLRDALGDSPSKPHFIETLPRRGYRFLAPVETAIRSVAVLPLLDLSRDASQEYFADGMTEVLTSDLGQIGRLRVISRTSAMTYKGSHKPLREIARELNVDALVEGSVLRVGRRVRIIAQLIDAATDTHLWAATYERDLEDVLRLQSEVAQAIAREVKAAVTSEEAARVANKPTVKPEAYEAYLKGMFHLNKYTPDGLERGITYLQDAAKKDPSDAFAYAALALGYGMIGHDRAPDALAQAKAAARKSLEVGGPLAEAYLALAMHELYWDWDIQGAGRDLGHALKIKPSFAEARRHYAWYLRLLGQRNQSIEEMKQATALEPLVPQFHADLATLNLHEGRLDAALAEAMQALEFDPAFAQGLAVAGAAYAARHMYEEALAFHRKAAAGDAAWKWPLGRTYALMGRKSEAIGVATEIQKAPGAMGEWGLAIIFAALGEKDEAFCWLERAYQAHFSWMPWNHAFAVPEQDLFATLRDDTRFRDLARRVVGVRLGNPTENRARDRSSSSQD